MSDMWNQTKNGNNLLNTEVRGIIVWLKGSSLGMSMLAYMTSEGIEQG